MKKLALLASLALLMVAGCRCSPTPLATAPPMTPDAGSTACAAACTHLASLGCPEGQHPNDCAATCALVERTQLVSLDVPCVIAAQTVAAVQACGVRCAP